MNGHLKTTVLFLLVWVLSAACTPDNPAPGKTTPAVTGTGAPGSAPTGPVPAATLPAEPTVTPTVYPGAASLPFQLGATAGWPAAVDDAPLQLTITQAFRGYAARRAIIEAGEADVRPPEGYEYLYFRVLVEYDGPDTGPVALNSAGWQAISNSITMTWEDAPLCCLAPQFDFSLSAGQIHEGALALLVAVDDPAPLVGLVPDDGMGGAVFFEAAAETLSTTDVLYEDAFHSALSGWQDIYRDETGISDYDQGGFRLQVLEPNFDYWANPGLDFVDAAIEVDAAVIGGSEDNVFGLVCRYTGLGDFYFLVIASDGYYAIGKYLAGEQLLIGSDAMLPTDLVAPGDVSHHLRAECIGETLRLFVNGTLIYEVSDPDHSHGDVGIFAGTFETAGTDILFDNFVVLAP